LYFYGPYRSGIANAKKKNENQMFGLISGVDLLLCFILLVLFFISILRFIFLFLILILFYFPHRLFNLTLIFNLFSYCLFFSLFTSLLFLFHVIQISDKYRVC